MDAGYQGLQTFVPTLAISACMVLEISCMVLEISACIFTFECVEYYKIEIK